MNKINPCRHCGRTPPLVLDASVPPSPLYVRCDCADSPITHYRLDTWNLANPVQERFTRATLAEFYAEAAETDLPLELRYSDNGDWRVTDTSPQVGSYVDEWRIQPVEPRKFWLVLHVNPNPDSGQTHLVEVCFDEQAAHHMAEMVEGRICPVVEVLPND